MASTHVKLPQAASIDVGVTGADGAVQFSDGAGDLASDETKLFWDDTNNRLGVGTNAPAYPLEVRASNNYGAVHSDGTVKIGTFVDGSDGYLGTQSNHDLSFFTNDGSASVTVKTTGNVEILTSGAKLSVGGDTPGATIDAKTAVADTALRITQAENGNHVSFKLPALSGNTTYTLPAADGTSGQVLKSNGSGALSFTYDIASPNSATAVSNINITGGDITGNVTNDGADIYLTCGDTSSTDPESGGGRITITGGAQTATQTGNAGEGQGGGDIFIVAGEAKNQFGGSVQITAGNAEWQGGDVYIQAGGGLIDDDGYGGSTLIYGGSVTGGTAQAGHIDFIPGENPDTDTLNGKIRCQGVFKMYNLDADPTAGENGDMYYNTTTNKFRGYANGAWIDLH